MSRTDRYYMMDGDQLKEFEDQSAFDAEVGAILAGTKTLDVVNVSEQGLPVENPKAVQAQKDGKHPFEYIPLRTLAGAAYVLQHGAEKYGIRNWRQDHIKASTYKGAFMRHLEAYYEGETIDPDSGQSHLSHIMANCMVMLDAALQGTLIDDRLITESKDV